MPANQTLVEYTDKQLLTLLAKLGTIRAVGREIGVPPTTLGDRIRSIDVFPGFEEYRNRGTTQLPLNQHPVYTSDGDMDLYLASDLHCGSETCHYEGIVELVNEVKDNPKARLVLGGDQMEMQPLDYQDCGRNSDSYIDGQIIRTQKGLEPIKDQILLMLSGNHGKARLAKAGIDPDLIVASTLGVPYATVPKVLTIAFKGLKRDPLKICIGHGKSGGMGDGMPELKRMHHSYPHCNIYALGHNHSLYANPNGAITVDDTGKEHYSPWWYCRTGSFMLYAEYARYAMYHPQPIGYVKAKIRYGIIESVETVKVQA